MNARFILIAAATLTSANAYAADPAKPAEQPPAHPDTTAPKVVLASAEVTSTPAPSGQQAQATPKRRVARVTGCRCGDQEAQPDEE